MSAIGERSAARGRGRVFGVAVAAMLSGTTGIAHAEPIVALLNINALIEFDSTTPGVTSAPVAIGGLGAGEFVRGIDYRPRDGAIYGLVSLSDGTGARLIRIDRATGASVAVAPLLDGGGGVLVPGADPVTLAGTRFGVDFNPQVDLLRVVSDAEQNLAVNTGGRAAGGVAGTTRQDGTLNIAGVPSPGLNVIGAAYDRNVDLTPGTTLYTIDTVSDLLYVQAPPNDGTQTSPQTLGIDAFGDAGFDISGLTGAAFASFATTEGGLAALFAINLLNGDATSLGTIGGQFGDVRVTDITVAPVPAPATIALFGATLLAFGTLRRRA